MLNFRKLRQDFASSTLKEGKALHEKSKIIQARIVRLNNEVIRFSAKVLGNFDNAYESELEVDRFESQAIHTNCDCPGRFDCQHLAGLIFFLEEKIDSLLIEYAKGSDFAKGEDLGVAEQKELLLAVEEAAVKEGVKQDARYQKEVLEEYIAAAEVLSKSPFFLPSLQSAHTEAELFLLFNPATLSKAKVEFQVAIRVPFRTKPLQVGHLKVFLDAVRYEEPLVMGGRKLLFTEKSFDEGNLRMLSHLFESARFQEAPQNERALRIAYMDQEAFGLLLSDAYELALKRGGRSFREEEMEAEPLFGLYIGTVEQQMKYGRRFAQLRFELNFLEPPATKLILEESLLVAGEEPALDEVALLSCAKPGLLFKETYYRFPTHIKRMHLEQFSRLVSLTIPEPLLGSFVENALPELKRFAEVKGEEVLKHFATLPFASTLKARCHLSYLDGELEAALFFSYDGEEVPSLFSELTYEHIKSFVLPEGILARNLIEEARLAEELFQDFILNPQTGTYLAKSEKKIVEFMTGIIPKESHRVQFECPQNLLDLFIYDETTFTLSLDAKDVTGYYEVDLQVQGALKGVKLDLLFECIGAKRSYLELDAVRSRSKDAAQFSKILVIDLDKMARLTQLFDELGIKKLDDHKELKPLWNLATIDLNAFEGLPVKFTMSKKLLAIRSQMLGEVKLKASLMPKEVKAELRNYQVEGVEWLERLRSMYLNGILADDMGLGKTVQAICAITQMKKANPEGKTLIVCPTSLVYNWKEELHRFNPQLKPQVIDGVPSQRKKLISASKGADVLITSYTLLQKDIETYQKEPFAYAILDEAQHIKNRGTRNAKSVKLIQAAHRLILTGTPIENALDELWSLMDFLMPGFLGSYDRFVEKYIRVSGAEQQQNIDYLRRKVSPFILRRMKSDVLSDLPPVSEIPYHCQLTDRQSELYKSYAESARNELVKLVARDGFDKVQIHVLATLTRLKQICCHPAIFAKEKAEAGDSAKYDMLLELLESLISSRHKTVIFSQYTKMLQIMRDDLEKRGIAFSYLDGASKNRLGIVKEFNENPDIPVFLVSLKAGGTGLNLTSADTVIHYDMWWNPAVENQATDRVHRLGQKNAVSAYKLITLGTIEEKIVEMQKRKKGLVKKVVSCDDEAIQKLTWEDVLELLQT